MELLQKCDWNFIVIEGNVDFMVDKISTNIQGVLGELYPMKTYTNHMKYKSYFSTYTKEVIEEKNKPKKELVYLYCKPFKNWALVWVFASWEGVGSPSE